MFPTPERSLQTVNLYKADAYMFADQFCKEAGPEVLSGGCHPDYFRDAPNEVLLYAAARWFLGQHYRWSLSHIKRMALALHQELERFFIAEMLDGYGQNCVEALLRDLKINRPNPATKTEKAGVKNPRTPYRKDIELHEVRGLIKYFRGRPDEFSHWIAGYILIASRIGWRPGEILMLRRHGMFLRAEAEKRGNERGLTDTCEIDISAYPPKMIAYLDQWIAGIQRWEEEYDGLKRLASNINTHMKTACRALGIARIAPYAFRHWAISCMKKSGFSLEEIAVLVNHATNRTAIIRYGKAKGGIKRAKKMLRYQIARLDLVRDKVRFFPKDPSRTPDI